jgi:hypothetical protein
MRGAALLLPILLVGCAPCPCEEEPAVAEPGLHEPVMGHWNGQGRQSDGMTWAMEVDVAGIGPGRCAAVSYPDVGCSGYWTCTEAGEGSMRGVEHITQGRDRCVDIAFEATVSEDGILEYHAADENVEAVARLARSP